MLSEILFLFFEIVNDISQFVDGLGRNLEKLQIFWIRLKIARKLFLSDSRSEIRVCVPVLFRNRRPLGGFAEELRRRLASGYSEDLSPAAKKLTTLYSHVYMYMKTWK